MTKHEEEKLQRNEQIKSLHANGISVKDLAKQFNVSQTTIYAVLNDYKPRRLSMMQPKKEVVLNPNINYDADKDARNRAIVEMFLLEHKTLKEIADIFGLTVSGVSKTVSRHRDKYGL